MRLAAYLTQRGNFAVFKRDIDNRIVHEAGLTQD